MKSRLLVPALVLATVLCGASDATDFYTLTSKRYRITTDVRQDLAGDIAAHMDAVNAAYARIFADLPDRGSRDYPLWVFTQQTDYMAFLEKYGVDGNGSGGMFFERWNGSGLTTFVGERSLERVFQTLRHEGFHQFARTKFGTGLPAWANEGLAEYFGEAIVIGGKLMVGQVPATRLARMKAAIKAEAHLPLGELMTMSKTEWNRRLRRGESKMQYQQSWLLVHFLFHEGSPYRSQFESYLRHIADGAESSEAFRKAFGTTDFSRYEKPFREYVMALEATPEKAAAQRLEFLAAGMKYLYTREKTVASLEDLKSQLRSVGTKGYWLRFAIGHDQTLEMRASDEENFRAPETAGGEAAQLEFTPSPEPHLPPTLAVKGLSCTVRLEWLKDADNLVSRIVYE